MLRVTEEEGNPCFHLQWSSPHTSLNLKDTNIQNADGLTRMQIQLLQQRGNVGEPVPPMSIRTAGEKLVGMAATVKRLRNVPKKELLDGHAKEPLAGEVEPEVPCKVAELPVEE
ncbi:hypothetical protein BGZ72_001374 [Mortierella alpina]|nr:hypothetical protein BGZ72_001374 [Mortierella alpina]